MKNVYTFDIGNTHPHVGHFQEGNLLQIIDLNTFLKNNHSLAPESLILRSTVGPVSFELEDFFMRHSAMVVPLSRWKEGQKFRDMPLHYNEKLGEDRLYQSYFLYKTEPEIIQKYHIVFIDAGTFTTVDFISADGFLGGFIFPGNQTYLDLFNKGKLLPNLETSQLDRMPELQPGSFPHSTEEAIMQGLKVIINGIYQHIDQQLSDNRMCFIVTGGQGKSHWKSIKGHDTSSNLLLPYRHDIIHHSLHYLGNIYQNE